MNWMAATFSKERTVAPDHFNRWLAPLASIAIHLCIGAVYAWSLFNAPLTRVQGVVASAAGDWNLSQVVWIFTVAIVCLGLAAAFGGRWLERVGPRLVGVVSAACWGGGFLVAAAGIHTQQLWLLYLGYGVLGGCGLGLGYVSPVSTLLRWFPDRRGMATGMAIMGFGGGAIIAAPLKDFLIRAFYRAPEYLGDIANVELVTIEGRRFAETAGGLREVVTVAAHDVPQMIVPGPEGAYLVGTGSVGIFGTFMVLGMAYFAVMIVAAFAFRTPPPGWQPPGWTPPDESKAKKRMMTRRNVDINQALKTPQFYLLWLVLCLNVTAGIGVLGVARTMMTEIFGSTLPHIVDGAFAATYVVMISVFNMGGRLCWASASDYLGRKRTYWIFFALGSVLYLSIPLAAHQVSVSPSVVWLVYFYAATMLIFTMYGGGFATIPAYLADVFGSRFVGGIHGRLLTAWSAAGLLGPLAITTLRQRAEVHAMRDLAGQADPEIFREHFGAGIDQLELLMREKTVTVATLMDIAPADVPHPGASLYDSTMFLMVGLLLLALVANALMRPVNRRHYMPEEGGPKPEEGGPKPEESGPA